MENTENAKVTPSVMTRKDDKEWSENVRRYRLKKSLHDYEVPNSFWFRVAREQMAWDMVWENHADERTKIEEGLHVAIEPEIWLAKQADLKAEGQRLIKMEDDRFDELWARWRHPTIRYWPDKPDTHRCLCGPPSYGCCHDGCLGCPLCQWPEALTDYDWYCGCDTAWDEWYAPYMKAIENAKLWV